MADPGREQEADSTLESGANKVAPILHVPDTRGRTLQKTCEI